MPEDTESGIYLEEVVSGHSIEGVATSTGGLLGSIRRGADAGVKTGCPIMLGVLVGAVAAIAVDRNRRWWRRDHLL